MDTQTITVIGTTTVIVIGALRITAVAIIKEISKNRAVTIAGQEAGAVRGRVRDKKIKEIHVLTNSRLTAALRLIMIMAKKESERTQLPEDIALYKQALVELQNAEEATNKIFESSEDEENAKIAEDKLALIQRK